MPHPRQQRIRELFDAVHDLDAAAQQDFLLRNCAGDHELAGAVWKLLLARQRSDGILDTPVVRRQETPVEPAEPGARIGPYKILKKLGDGGMGVVYQALRSDGVFHRLSALKVIRPELANSALVQNFYSERQILAKLDHPNIARIVDGGATPEGLPFFVMDFVDGVPLQAFCSEKGLGFRGRLLLFLQVCAAVEYLHKNGVLHCDLKPGNMLVDKGGAVKLLDFGIARLAGTGNGAFNLPLMTPHYASPEQLRGEPATPASDVYSLGVTLYEILSGRRPFESKTNQELITAIVTSNPIPPSSAASLDQSKIGPIHTLRGDLDAVVLKALQRDPTTRYPSVAALREDVERYLGCRPVSARRASLFYSASKFLSRRARETAAASFIGLLVGVLAWQALVMKQRYQFALAREHALEQELRKAQQHLLAEQLPASDATQAEDLRSLAGAYRTSFSDAIRVWPGSNDTRRRLLNETAVYLTDSAPRARQNTTALEQLVAAWVELANVAGNPNVPNLGDKARARESLRQAASIVGTLVASGADAADVRQLEQSVASSARAVDTQDR